MCSPRFHLSFGIAFVWKNGFRIVILVYFRSSVRFKVGEIGERLRMKLERDHGLHGEKLKTALKSVDEFFCSCLNTDNAKRWKAQGLWWEVDE